jgi:hypothetical protein
MAAPTRYLILGTKGLSVFFGVVAALYGAAALIFGLTPHGNATVEIRLYGLAYVIFGIMWALPNRSLVKYRAIVFSIFGLVAGTGIYSISRLYSAGLGPDNFEEAVPLIFGIVPFIPIASLILYHTQQRHHQASKVE